MSIITSTKKIREEYPDKIMTTFSVLPSPKVTWCELWKNSSLCPLGFWYSSGALQCKFCFTPFGGEHWSDLHDWQWGFVWYLLQEPETHQSFLWWPQPPGVTDHVWCDHMSQVPRPAQCWPQEAGCQHGPLPQAPLFHAWLCSTHL